MREARAGHGVVIVSSSSRLVCGSAVVWSRVCAGVGATRVRASARLAFLCGTQLPNLTRATPRPLRPLVQRLSSLLGGDQPPDDQTTP